MNEIDDGNRYGAYRAGWLDGSSVRMMKEVFTKNSDQGIVDEYNAGYTDGRDARNGALNAAAKRIGFTPSVLRISRG